MAFVIGTIIASFSYVVGVRLPQQQNWWWARSQCPHCQHMLQWYELVPLLSFIWQRGRCRRCHARISWQYMAVELIGGLVSALFFTVYGASLQWLLLLCLLMFCVIVSVADALYMIVPNRVLLFVGIPLCALYSLQQDVYSMIVGAAVGFTLLYTLHRITGGVGAGDVKLIFILGAIVQIQQLFMLLFIACLMGFCFFFWKRQHIMPFAPALCAATLITLYIEQLQWLTLY